MSADPAHSPATTGTDRPTLGRRLAAILSILLVAVVAIASVVLVLDSVGPLIVVLALFAVLALAVWYALTRAGGTRTVAVVFAIAAVVGVVALVISESAVWSLVVRIALLVLAAGLARYALARDVRTLKRGATTGTPVPAAERGVLIMNLKSGGGKAERFHLEDECRRRGIEPVVLRPGNDLLVLARDAIDRGADVIGMAGGDGSQALVASIAAERGVPMVVIPAGTRNHLALDLGIDRDDVVGALDAFGDAVERPMDLAEVNGHVFVNNVSLGLYAAIVQSPEYRDAKVDTTLSALPKLLGPGSRPVDLRFDGPDGTHHDSAHVVMVSNGPYGSTLATMATRARIDTGSLGVFSLVIPDDAAAKRFLAALTTNRPDRYDGYDSWSGSEFVIDSGSPVAVGLDGEAMDMPPPLRFSIRPHALRVRLAHDAIGYSPAARASSARSFLPNLWRVALGHPVAVTS
jgi:diacylglycerol kinase family enzyme